MINRPHKEKIIWAVDIFEDPIAQKRMLKVMGLWAKGVSLDIQPTYVFGVHNHRPPANDAKTIERELNIRFSRFMAGARLPPLTALKVLYSKDSSLRGKADALLQHACAEEAAVIALATRARKGVSRWAFGSLTETLILSSHQALLTLNPEARQLARLKDVLFPTDLSKESDRALMMVIEQSKLRGLNLMIAYCSQFDQSHSAAAYGPAVGYAQSRRDYMRNKRAELQVKVRIAEAHGLKAAGIFLERKYDVAVAILEAAVERKVQMIAMASHCGPVTAALGGSVTRRIIRAAPCPVLAVNCA
jgi:nucleotide-binding universal stress UspA family protein